MTLYLGSSGINSQLTFDSRARLANKGVKVKTEIKSILAPLSRLEHGCHYKDSCHSRILFLLETLWKNHIDMTLNFTPHLYETAVCSRLNMFEILILVREMEKLDGV